ncbi:cytochrome c oxidase subunit I [soil metagenome]
MSDALPNIESQPLQRLNYINHDWSVMSWICSKDHKRIGLMYLITITFFFFLGSVPAILIRLQLLTPAGVLVTHETYNRLFTMHGVTMVWFFLIPSIPVTFGNILLPMMIGARDLAFPRMNLASYYIFLLGAILAMVSLVRGGVDTGWTFYTPYSTTFSNSAMTPMIFGIFVSGFSSIFTGLNFIVTVHTMRCPGMYWSRLPLFVWSMYATSLILVLATPVLAITLLLMAAEHGLGIGIFNPALGGDPLLFQHLFWFYSHPAVYIMILPSMGVVSELIATFSRKRVFGYFFVAYSSVVIAVLGFLVWGHHMFVSGQSMYAGMVFSILSFLVAVPSAIKVFNWTMTLYKGSIILKTPLLYALGFLGLFTIGGLTGIMLAALSVDVHVHDTYFVIAHFHYIMVGGTMMAYLGGLHYWWPKITGRMYPEGWGVFSAVLLFFGFNLTFFPQFLLGYMGMVRRVAEYDPHFQVLNVLSTAGASILGVAYLLPLCYFLWSLRYEPVAGNNPWNATGLEWQSPSPPPELNFTQPPVVTGPAYDYDTEKLHEEGSVPHV